MQNDKKNNSNGINFTLLSSIGNAEINKYVDKNTIEDAISYYIEISL
jgi:3-dehydroquinate synthetase